MTQLFRNLMCIMAYNNSAQYYNHRQFMSEQNFDQDLISECVPVVKVTNRLGSIGNHSPKPSSRTKQLMFSGGRSKSKTHKGRTHSIIQSGAKFERLKQEKIQQRRQMQERDLLKECTFKPRVNKNQDRKRTLKEFLDFQDMFLNKVDLKRQRLQTQMKQNAPEYSFKPKINNNSLKTPRQCAVPVYQRLYSISKRDALTERSALTEGDFVPAITARSRDIVRQTPIAEHLYSDALRRQKQETQRSQKQVFSRPENKQKSLVNQKIVAQRFIKEYFSALEDLDTKNKLTFEQFVRIIYSMGFITASPDDDDSYMPESQKALLIQAFQFLQVPTKRNVCVFMLGLIGVYNVNPVNFCSSTPNEYQLEFTSENGRKIQSHFQLFFRNRLSTQFHRKSSTLPDDPSFVPSINPKSKALASVHRSKMLQQASSMLEESEIGLPNRGVISISHSDLLYLDAFGKLDSTAQQKQRVDLQLKGCTFNPSRSQREFSTDAGANKCEELYRKAKTITKEDRSDIDREYLQQQKQCTFKPVIHQAPLRKEILNEPAPDFSKSICRVLQGRRLKQQRLDKLGWMCEDKSTPSKNSLIKQQHSRILVPTRRIKSEQQQQQQPFLVIDVNLGEVTEQIVVRQQDIQEQERLASEFSRKYKLDWSSEEKLTQLLRTEIDNALNRIVEEGERESGDD